MALSTNLEKLLKKQERIKLERNAIEGIFDVQNSMNFIVLIRTKEETLEEMRINAPFPLQISRLDETKDLPCECIKIKFPPGSDHGQIKTSIHPMAKRHGINTDPKVDSAHLTLDINT